MIEAPGRIKKSWRIGVMACVILGLLALIPLAIDRHTYWPWAPIVSIILWIAAWILYMMGMKATGKPLRRPRNR
ncbi:MAG: hypothetical protein Q7T05_03355 [Dehalococcoidia bacterium]|nr:hypothetical protein [Dehalococcoidia bacterium]